MSSRKGIATRATNAGKHPGFLALDDEDLKTLKKKDDAALHCQAKAEEKKTYQARLQANTDRIAAFEDSLSVQHAEELANAARPATRAAQTKNDHRKTLVSHTSAESQVIPANLDGAQDLPSCDLVESDASRTDDKDYAPSCESESEVLTICGHLTY